MNLATNCYLQDLLSVHLKLLWRRNPLIRSWTDNRQTSRPQKTRRKPLLLLLKNGKTVGPAGKGGQTPAAIRKMRAGSLAPDVWTELAFGLSEFENVEQYFSLQIEIR